MDKKTHSRPTTADYLEAAASLTLCATLGVCAATFLAGSGVVVGLLTLRGMSRARTVKMERHGPPDDTPPPT